MIDQELICPFCQEDGFDDIGLVRHFAAYCPAYDNACRRSLDEEERRQARMEERRA